MRRTILAARSQWGNLILCWLVLPPLLVIFHVAKVTDPYFIPLTAAILVVPYGYLTLDTVLSRATVDGERLVFRSPLPSRRLRTPLSGVLLYHPMKDGSWAVDVEGRTVRVPFESPWDLHAALVEHAHTKLGAKRLRPLPLPPGEQFTRLWTFDTDRLRQEAVGRMVLFLVIFGFFRSMGPALAGQLVGLLILTSFRIWGRLDVTDEGIALRAPFHRRRIAWSEATAIFCENPKERRSFVVTALGRGIEIPAHLAIDVDLMRKVFRSVPQGTLVVNFDETTFRGYRRRKKAEVKEPARGEDLLPALTGWRGERPAR